MSHTDVNAHTEPAEVVEHPQWCTAAESDTEAIHYSERFACDPDGDGNSIVELQLLKTWPWHGKDDLPAAICLIITDEGVERQYFLPLKQVRDLVEQAQLLLGWVGAR